LPYGYGGAMTIGADGQLYVASQDQIYRVARSGGGELVASGFNDPQSIALDRRSGRLFVDERGTTSQDIAELVPSRSVLYSYADGCIGGGAFYDVPGPTFPA